MNWQPLYSAIDQKPFHPFAVSLTSGERIEVAHPENIHLLPSRQTVNHIEVYRTGTDEFTIIWPEAVAAIHFNGQKTPLA